MGKLSDTLNAIIGKVDNTEARYGKVLEQKEESLLVLQAELQHKQNDITELHKMKLLGDITEETFNKQNEKFLVLQEKVAELQKEITLIQQYERADVLKYLEEMQATEKEQSASHRNEIRQMQRELLEAKAEYLHKMREMKKRYDKAVAPVNKIQSLEQKLGLRQNVYTNNSHEGLNNIRVGEASYINLQVNEPEVFNALYTGDIDQRLQKIIADMKAEGKIKG